MPDISEGGYIMSEKQRTASLRTQSVPNTKPDAHGGGRESQHRSGGKSKKTQPASAMHFILPSQLDRSKPGQGVIGPHGETSSDPNYVAFEEKGGENRNVQRHERDPKNSAHELTQKEYEGQPREQLDQIIEASKNDPVKAIEEHRKSAEEKHGQAITSGTNGWGRFQKDQEYVKSAMRKGGMAANEDQFLPEDNSPPVAALGAIGLVGLGADKRNNNKKNGSHSHRRGRSILPWVRDVARRRNPHGRTRRKLPRLGIVPMAVGVVSGVAALAHYGGNASWGRAIKSGLNAATHFFVPQAARDQFSRSAELLKSGELRKAGKALTSGLYEIPLIGGVVDLVRDPVRTIKEEVAGVQQVMVLAQDAYALAQSRPDIARQAVNLAGSIAAQDDAAVLHGQQQLASSAMHDASAREFTEKHYSTLQAFGAVPKSAVPAPSGGQAVTQTRERGEDDAPMVASTGWVPEPDAG